jgi:hypothetical protein
MFAFLLNATDYEANTPFHIAVESGHPSMVSSPLQTMSVEVGITKYQHGWSNDCSSCLQSSGAYFLVMNDTICFQE